MKVICIKDGWKCPVDPNLDLSGEDLPVKGRIYTVRKTVTIGSNNYYMLAEIRPINNIVDGVFNASKFRPITDISSLTTLTKVRELEDA